MSDKLTSWLSLKIQLYRLRRKKDRLLAVFAGQKISDQVKLGEALKEIKIDLERGRFVLDLVEQDGGFPGHIAKLVAERLQKSALLFRTAPGYARSKESAGIHQVNRNADFVHFEFVSGWNEHCVCLRLLVNFKKIALIRTAGDLAKDLHVVRKTASAEAGEVLGIVPQVLQLVPIAARETAA